MNVIIAGSRRLRLDPHEIGEIVEASGFDVERVVSGGAHGVDDAGAKWAWTNDIPIAFFMPMWDEHGRGAGPIRNKEMADNADALILVWDGESRGAASMKREAERVGIPIFEVIKEGS